MMDSDERERRAREELGRTAVGRWLARVTSVGFVLALFSVPAVQHAERFVPGAPAPLADSVIGACLAPGAWSAEGPDAQASRWARWRIRNEQLRVALGRCEERLEEESRPWSWLQARTQSALTRWLRAGNEQVVIGADGWLFYRPDIDTLTAPGLAVRPATARIQGAGDERVSDPLPAILRLAADLRQRGIALIVMPVPVKPAIHADRLFSVRTRNAPAAPSNPGFAPLFAELRKNGVTVVDLTAEFLASGTESPSFLATDTHWRPEAVKLAADRGARAIEAVTELPARSSAGFVTQRVTVTATGDTAALLGLGGASDLVAPESVEVQRVLTPQGASLQPQAPADVLVLGDSFTNIYSLDSLGWGVGGGFAEQLALALQRPVDRLSQNDRGATAPREMLARDLARGHDRLATTRAVVWQFSSRELVFGDWRVIPLPRLGDTDRAAMTSSFVIPPSGESWEVTGRIAAISAVPRPGSVPYRDHILSLHLVDVEGAPVAGSEAVVYTWSMREFELTPAARWQPGARVRLRLRAWADVARQHEGVNRSELSDERLLLEEPCWADSVR